MRIFFCTCQQHFWLIPVYIASKNHLSTCLYCRDPVHIMQKKDRIACGTFIQTVDGMCTLVLLMCIRIMLTIVLYTETYTEIAFDVYVHDDP
jgi:hypothetical protein